MFQFSEVWLLLLLGQQQFSLISLQSNLKNDHYSNLSNVSLEGITQSKQLKLLIGIHHFVLK